VSGAVWGPFMFMGTLVMIFTGYPVAFALGGSALIFAFLGSMTGDFSLSLNAIVLRTFGTMQNQTLLAVPFFIFMGTVLEKSKLAEQLLETIGLVFGRFRGGLALGVVVVGAMLAAATGVVGASVTAMGLISLPVMLRNGYSAPYSLGTIAASGTLGQIIPPSTVLIVLGDQMGVSVGDLFAGAFIPGIALAGSYAVYCMVIAFLRPDLAPALDLKAMGVDNRDLARRVVVSLIPPLTLIAIVLGSIFTGVATPTDAGALGSVGALVLAWFNKGLNMRTVVAAMEETSRLTIMVTFLLIGSTAFALVFRGLQGDVWITDLLTDLPGGWLGFLIFINLAVFILGFFIDFFEIAFIIVPLLVAPARLLGVDLVWLGIILGVNLQTSFLTPPFGFALFYLRGVTPKHIPTEAIYRGVIPFIVLQVIVLGILIYLGKPAVPVLP
jgi:tripartite ATP-independent transporter DctM subunit